MNIAHVHFNMRPAIEIDNFLLCGVDAACMVELGHLTLKKAKLEPRSLSAVVLNLARAQGQWHHGLRGCGFEKRGARSGFRRYNAASDAHTHLAYPYFRVVKFVYSPLATPW